MCVFKNLRLFKEKNENTKLSKYYWSKRIFKQKSTKSLNGGGKWSMGKKTGSTKITR